MYGASAMQNNGLVVFTVYENPSDYPGKFVVRRWVGMDPSPTPEYVEDSLEMARKRLLVDFPYLERLDRSINDDPVILETWI